MLKLIPYDSLLLNSPTKFITEMDKNIEVAKELRTYLVKNKSACGIAANQLGIDASIFCAKFGTFIVAFINPVIDWEYTKQQLTSKAKEGCLSLPGKQYTVERYLSVKISYFDIKGQEVKDKVYEAYQARIVQHEYDHLQGILISQKENKK